MNRKGWPSCTIMAVCDAFMRFIHLVMLAPGAVHDARVFNCSDLNDVLNNKSRTLEEMYLLGDAAYGSRFV